MNSVKAEGEEETNPESGLAVSVLLKEDDNSQMQGIRFLQPLFIFVDFE